MPSLCTSVQRLHCGLEQPLPVEDRTRSGWVPVDDLLTARFLCRHTAFSSFDELLAAGAFVIAGRGGGIPVMRRADGSGMEGVEAVIDKDLCSALIGSDLKADCLVIATDVDAAYVNWGQPAQRKLQSATADELAQMHFAQGSMAPKVEAVIDFVRATRKRAVIGSLDHIEDMLAGRAGTQITP